MSSTYTTQNDLLLKNLLEFYNNADNLDKMLCIINGESRISLRIVDWFATNYSKKHYTVYTCSYWHTICNRWTIIKDLKYMLIIN